MASIWWLCDYPLPSTDGDGDRDFTLDFFLEGGGLNLGSTASYEENTNRQTLEVFLDSMMSNTLFNVSTGLN